MGSAAPFGEVFCCNKDDAFYKDYLMRKADLYRNTEPTLKDEKIN